MGDSAGAASVEGAKYKVKWIYQAGVWLPFCMQNKNGPCPMLAMVNVLLLRGNLELAKGTSDVTDAHLQAIITEYLNTAPSHAADASEEFQVNHQVNLAETIALLPRLNRGIDVNVFFTAVDAFEFTRELGCFDLLRVRLLHGWLVDPVAEAELYSVVDGKSFNQILDLLVQKNEQATQQPSPSTAPDAAQEGALIQTFLDDYASQLTYHGLTQLHAAVAEGETCVLFRNNHFSTIHKRDGALYVLVSDQGYLNETAIVWELLQSVTGESTFVDANFQEFVAGSPRAAAIAVDYEEQLLSDKNLRQTGAPVSADEALARRLQDQELERSKRDRATPSRQPPSRSPPKSKTENCCLQ